MSGIVQGLIASLKSAVAATTDTYFNLVTLLLNTTSTSGAQNNSFLDSSSNGFTITRAPATGPLAPTQGTFTPFSQTGWSNFFPASGSYATVPASSDFAPGTGDFTVDGWIFTGSNTLQTIFAQTVAGTNYFVVEANAPTNRIQLTSTASGGGTAITSAATLVLNAWNYFCVSRTSGTVTVWCNGSAGTPTSNTTNLTNTTYVPTIGTYSHATTTNPLIGYLSNLRYIKGTALSGSTVPTAPFATNTTNQTLLTCQSNRFFDANTTVSAKTITPVGSSSVQAFSPFLPTAAYDTTTVGGSGYFDGTGDYLAFPTSNATLLPSTGQFTFELWFYCSSTAFQTLFSYGSSTGNLRVFIQDGGLQVWNGSSQLTAGNLNLIKYRGWNHAVIQRNATNLVTYVNGTRDYNTANSTNFSSGSLQVAAEVGSSLFTGYISGFSYIKGSATYSGTPITLPTAPPSPTGTTACLNFTNAGIYDATAKSVLETVGNVQVASGTYSPTATGTSGASTITVSSATGLKLGQTVTGTGIGTNAIVTNIVTTTVTLSVVNSGTVSGTMTFTDPVKFGTTSMYFDGTGDYLLSPYNKFYDLTQGDFTIEGWFYRSASGVEHNILNQRGASSGWLWRINSGNTVTFSIQGTTTTTITSTGTIPTNTWTYIAVARSGANMRIFINGTIDGSSASTVNGTSATVGLRVGCDDNLTLPFKGYMDDVRITRYARYTVNFTAPAAAFPLQ